jgi:hypothetical protein
MNYQCAFGRSQFDGFSSAARGRHSVPIRQSATVKFQADWMLPIGRGNAWRHGHSPARCGRLGVTGVGAERPCSLGNVRQSA